MQIYVDLDGVFADFDGGYELAMGARPNKDDPKSVDWRALEKQAPRLYSGLPLMPGALELWDYLRRHDPIVLTGKPLSLPAAEQDKRNWVAQVLCPDARVDVCLSKEKFQRAKPGDILIDDWPKYQHLWEQAGGIWITHTSAANTIEQLKERGL